MSVIETRLSETQWAPLRDLDDVAEIERVPFERRIPFSTTYEMLLSATERFKDRPALTILPNGTPFEGEISYSYRALLDSVTRAANLFNQIGLRRDESVSLLLPNIPEFQFALWGGEAAGRANPINPLLDCDAIRAILEAAGSKILVTLASGHPSGLYERAKAACPRDVTLMVVGNASSDDPAIDFRSAMNDCRGDRLDFALPETGCAIASLYHTGGTTGQLKLVTHSHINEIANAWQSSCCFAFTGRDVVFNAAPLFHVTGTILLSLAPFSVGAHVVMGGPSGFRSPETIAALWDIISDYQVSVICGVPTVYANLLNSPVGDRDISSLRFAICGAAPLPPYVAETFHERTGVAILEGYGMTESCSTSVANPRDGERRTSSIGIRAPYQDVRVAILDDDGGFLRDANVDEAGALLLRGPNVTPGYLPESINKRSRPLSDWLDTGDTARMDEEGYVFLTGRKKDLIIRSGHNIDPAIVENALAEHPAVSAVAAVGKPDGYAGELPVAYVVKRPGHNVTAVDLLIYARDRVAERPAAPSDIFFVDTLPMTPVGKVFKPTLRLDATRRACLALLTPALDAALDDVCVSSDPAHGLLVEVIVAGELEEPTKEIVRQMLRPLSLRYQIRAAP